jgi:hypothetical protein
VIGWDIDVGWPGLDFCAESEPGEPLLYLVHHLVSGIIQMNDTGTLRR